MSDPAGDAVIHVGFVMPGVTALLAPDPPAVYGGSERRALRFAHGLAQRGLRVTIIGFGHCAIDAAAAGPLAVEVEPAPRTGWRKLLRQPALSEIERYRKLWGKADCDLYVTFGVADLTAELARWCHTRGVPSVLFAGSDIDFSPEYRPDNATRNAYGSRCDLCHEAVAGVTAIVVQTRTQQTLARERFGRAASIIANPIAGPIAAPPVAGEDHERRHVLWVGKTDGTKRPEVAIELARRCPAIAFRMIVNPTSDEKWRRLTALAPANVTLVDRVPATGMAGEFAAALALLNTSLFEGFPNTFLEAGCAGTPVISLAVDPDGVIEHHRGGSVAHGDIAAAAAAIERYHADPALAREAGCRLRDYVMRQHEAEARFDEAARLLRETVRSPRAAGGMQQ